jgi:hypothetical protein
MTYPDPDITGAYILFNDTLSSSHYAALNDKIWKEAVMA